ncbi:MAG: hypothetical protein ABJM29_03745 [Rhizobiaceae bacterium]
MKLFLILLGLMVSGLAHAGQIQTRSANGFTATAALIGDSDWAAKWSNLDQMVPDFDLIEQINEEQNATLLIFFSNPSRDQENIRVSCKMEIRDVRKQIVARLDPRICLAESASSEAADVYLFPDMELTTAHATASGPLALTISVTDEISNKSIELQLDIEVDKQSR